MLLLAVVGCGLIGAASAADVLSITIANIPPANASAEVDPSFAGFGIEPSQLFAFMGGAEANALTANLLENLVNFTGQPPHIRLGGNTQDYMIYRESQDEWKIKANVNATGNGSIAWDQDIIGPRYFEAANRLPTGTPVTWGLNLAYADADYVEQITAMAQQVIDRCTNIDLVSFEIGNEPDVYLDNGFRTGDWGGSAYTAQWLARASAVWTQVLQPLNLSSNFFDLSASTAWVSGTTFEITDLVSYGIEANANDSTTSYIASWDQHDYYYFIGSTDYALTLELLLNLEQTETQLESLASQLSQSRATGYPYALREMGVVGPLGQVGTSDTFAAALWTLNFLMYAASINISSVQFHMTSDSNASAWQPVELHGRQAFVRPLYYGTAAFDQIIGSSCSARISQVGISAYPSGYEGFVKAYSVYKANALASIVVVNGKLANVSDTAKANMTVQLTLPTSLAGQMLHLSHLTSDGADATANTTWNGISFEQNGDGTSTKLYDDDTTVEVGTDGTVTFTVRDSQAIVANIGRNVGTLPENATTCSAVASSGVGATSTATAGSVGTSDTSNNKDNASLASASSVATGVILSIAFAAGVLII